MSKRLKAALLCAGALGAFGSAHADPGGTSNVSGPAIAQGEWEFEARTATFVGGALDENWAHRAHLSYAPTDWWKPTLIVRVDDPSSGGAELSSVALENAFDFVATRDWPVHLGAVVQYAWGADGADDEIELKLLAERRFGPAQVRLNLRTERAIGGGAPDEWTNSYAARVTWRASDAISLGLEGFGDDENAHYWGPRASLAFGDIALSGAYLFAAGDANADGQMRLTLEIAR